MRRVKNAAGAGAARAASVVRAANGARELQGTWEVQRVDVKARPMVTLEDDTGWAGVIEPGAIVRVLTGLPVDQTRAEVARLANHFEAACKVVVLPEDRVLLAPSAKAEHGERGIREVVTELVNESNFADKAELAACCDEYLTGRGL